MIVGNIEVVTVIVILLFLIPVLWNIYKSELFKKFTFIELVRTFNKSLKIQGIIAISLIPISWFWNKFDFIFDYIIAGTVYTYIVIGIFMYLPSLAFLNLIKLILEARIEKNNKSTITLENGTSFRLNKKIIDSKILDDIVIVITDPNYEKLSNENVYCFDFYGKQLWQIEDLKLFHKKHDYTSMNILNNEFYIYNRCGVEIKINPKTGEVLSKELIK